MTTNNIVPNYVDIDYTTMLNSLKTLLQNTDTFKDYNFEGANITILMELLSYLGELNTYYTNQLAKNIHPETANVYENVHSIVRRQGYEPKGFYSGTLNLTVTVQDDTLLIGDQLFVPAWFKIKVKDITTTDGSDVYYTTVKPTIANVAQNYRCTFDLKMVQGEPSNLLSYSFEDIIDNKIILPFNQWDHNIDNNSIQLFMGDDEILWERIENPFDLSSILNSTQNVYMLKYDKYKRYVIQFISSRNIPVKNDIIKIRLVNSNGTKGDIGSNVVWEKVEKDDSNEINFITNLRTHKSISINNFELNNTYGSVNSSDPEDITTLTYKGDYTINSQRRDVIPREFINHLKSKNDIVTAGVWGEKEECVGFSNIVDRIPFYNNIFLSIIPKDWEKNDNTSNNSIIRKSFIKEVYNQQSSYTKGEIVYYENLGQKGYYEYNVDGLAGSPSNDPSSWLYRGSIDQFDRFTNGDYQSLVGSNSIKIPSSINESFKYDILGYLEPTKLIGINEIFILPELVFFKFDVGLVVKRGYNFVDIQLDILDKMRYFFKLSNRSFGDLIDPRELEIFILDTTVYDSVTNNYFVGCKGIYTLTIRDMVTCTPTKINYSNGNSIGADYVYDQFGPDLKFQPMSMFPYYVDINTRNISNKYNDIRPIQLSYKQFPIFADDYTNIFNEGR